ncbi:MAG: ATP-binding cassette domain-containing protein [Clostridia bacterium]|nr:ATP-binding cassette domain-containing protein [Clostridia bacterium]
MIATKDLSVSFSEGEGISYRDLVFEEGRSYVLLGASGCGKSTLLNMLAGIISPSTGTIHIGAREMTSVAQREKDAFRIAHIGYIFQDFKLIEDMTVEDNISILRLEKVDISHMDELLDELGILKLKKRKVARLSGGEKQRVAIARALVKQPDIILADEPTGNLNYTIGRKIMEELTKASKGRTLICVTHDDRLAELFDEVLDMNEITGGMKNGGAANA